MCACVDVCVSKWVYVCVYVGVCVVVCDNVSLRFSLSYPPCPNMPYPTPPSSPAISHLVLPYQRRNVLTKPNRPCPTFPHLSLQSPPCLILLVLPCPTLPYLTPPCQSPPCPALPETERANKASAKNLLTLTLRPLSCHILPYLTKLPPLCPHQICPTLSYQRRNEPTKRPPRTSSP